MLVDVPTRSLLRIRSVADTHTLIWYVFDDPRLSATASSMIDDAMAAGDEIGISSITLVEIVYLAEKRKIDPDTLRRVLDLLDLGAHLTEVPVDRSLLPAVQSIPRSEVPDMPDRIIAATALFLGVPLISRDGKIRASAVKTIW
jgi:PIN domain nuclease of toxin-antitoxin system